MSDRKIYRILIFLVLFIIGMYFYNKYKVAPSIKINQLELIDGDSKPFHPDSLKNKMAIVSFYASWCPECIRELKTLNSVIKDKLGNVSVFAITDESLENMVRFRDKKQYPFTFLKLQKSFRDIEVYSIPTVYLLNKKGAVVYQHVGFINWEDESTRNHLLKLMM